jgi:hypothetical protein
MKFYCLMFLMALQSVCAHAQGRSPINIQTPINERGGPWYAIVLGRMKTSGNVSGAMAAYEPTSKVASDKALKACRNRDDMTDCQLVIVAKDCQFVSIGTKDAGKEVKYIHAPSAAESLRLCAEGGFQCLIYVAQGCKP